MSDAVYRSGGGQQGYYMCSHTACHKKARNVDHFGRSPELLGGDHACCGNSRHATAHLVQDQERTAAKAAAARADAPPGPVVLLIRAIFRRVLDRNR